MKTCSKCGISKPLEDFYKSRRTGEPLWRCILCMRAAAQVGYLPLCAGIYTITHVASGKQYIGSSSYIGRRWHAHRTMLRQGTHDNRYLQSTWAKYGEDAFTFSVLEVIDSPTSELLVEREQHHLDSRRTTTGNDGLNLRCEANTPLGHPVSEQTRQKISTTKQGRTFTAEHRQKLSEARRRWSSTPTFRESRQGPRPTRRGVPTVWSEEAKAAYKAKRQAKHPLQPPVSE